MVCVCACVCVLCVCVCVCGYDSICDIPCAHQVELPAVRKDAQKSVDTAILSKLDKSMKAYLGAKFTLTKGQAPHSLVF